MRYPWIQSALVFSVLGFQNTTANCSEKDYAFAVSIYCDSGLIGIGDRCSCDGDSSCRLSILRSFLPPPSEFFTVISKRRCNDHLSQYLDTSIISKSIFKVHTGYPQDRICTNRFSNCHQPSFGKYMRYTSLMQYFRFEKAESPGAPLLYDIDFGGSFRWTKGITDCTSSGHYTEWNCIFKNMSDPSIKFSGSILSDELQFFNRLSMNFVEYRRQKKDHVVQLMIYGKLLAIMTRPTSRMIDYINDHIVSSHEDYRSHIESLHSSDNIDADDVEETFHGNSDAMTGEISEPCSMTSEKAKMTSRIHAKLCRVPSVSMHVRQGDSCEFIIQEPDDTLSSYLRGETRQRPCFSVDAYMKKLYLLRMMYGAHRVYLATDSDEMIQRTYRHKEYHWVYINISRDFLDKKHGWIDDRKETDNESILFSAVADLMLLKRGDIFLGSFSSHFSKLAYYTMAGTHMILPPFISLDYPLSCDTVDSCSDQEVMDRNFTIEEIISRAPECQRTVGTRITGFVEEGDPCGIYS